MSVMKCSVESDFCSGVLEGREIKRCVSVRTIWLFREPWEQSTYATQVIKDPVIKNTSKYQKIISSG